MIDRGRPMCGDVLELWATGRWALVLCFGAGALDNRWQVWRCPTCGFVAVHRAEGREIPGQAPSMT